MRNFNNHFILRAEAQDEGGEGGGGSAQSPAPTQSTPSSPEPKSPGVVEMAIAGLRNKATLNGEIGTLRQQVAGLETKLTAVTTERDQLAVKVADFESQHLQLSQALTKATEEKQTVDEAAAAKLRSHGVDPKQLPAANVDEQETKEALEAQLTKTTDPKEKFRITEKLIALEG